MKPLKQLLVPSLSELIIYSVISIVILAFYNLKPLLYTPLLAGSSSSSISSIFHQYADSTFVRIDQVGAIGRLTNVLIWASIGAITYMLVWAIFSVYVGVHNEVIMGTDYVEIGRNHRKSFWSSEISRGLFRGSVLLLILLLTSFSIQVLLPASAQMVSIWVKQLVSLKYCIYAIFGFVDLVILMHLYVVLLRLMFMRTRVFS